MGDDRVVVAACDRCKLPICGDCIKGHDLKIPRCDFAGPQPSPFESSVVNALERLIKIVDERIPIPVQISPRGVIRQSCYNTDGRVPTVLAAAAKPNQTLYPGAVSRFAVLGVVDFGVGGPAYRYAAYWVRDHAEARFAERGNGDTPTEATADVGNVAEAGIFSQLRMTLLDMIDHGESERILP